MPSEETGVVVVGAGQAGVAMSQHLGAHGIPHVVKDQVADHFVAYAEKTGAPVRCGVEVTSVRRHTRRAGFRVETSQGPTSRAPTVFPSETGASWPARCWSTGLFGIGYDFHEVWDVSRASFEPFTLGTVAALLLIGALGVAVARRASVPPAAADHADPGWTRRATASVRMGAVHVTRKKESRP